MKLEFSEKREIPLLSRTRAQFRACFDKETPSREKIRKEVANILKVKEDLTIIKHVYPRFGKKEAKVIAHVYENMNDLKRIEEAHLLKKHFKEEKKAEEPVAEAKAEG